MKWNTIALGLIFTLAAGGVAFADAGGGNGGATPPNIATPAAVGSPNAVPPSYGVSATVPTGSTTSSNHWLAQGPVTKTFGGQTVVGSTATLRAPRYAVD